MHNATTGRIPDPLPQKRLLRAPILAMAFSAAILSIVAALALITANRSHMIEAANRDNSNIARLVGFHVSHVLNSGTRLLDSVAESVHRHGMDYFQSAEGKQFLLSRTRGYPELQTMLLIDKTGQLLVGASVPYPVPDLNYSDRDYFILHKAGQNLVVGEQLLSRIHKRRGTTISRAIRSSHGELEGIVLITVESAHLEQLFETTERTANQEIMILRQDGAIFVSFPELDIGRRFPQAEALARAAETTGGSYEGIGMIDAKPRFFSYETIAEYPLVVITSQSQEKVLTSWHRFTAFVAGSLLLALGLLGAASRFAFRAAEKTEKLQLELERLAQTDSLTGLANHRHFMEQAERELSRSVRYGGTLSMLMLDIDHFKEINDTYGHGTGDNVLRHLAELFRLELRDIDIVGRLGGEEFAIVLSQTGAEQAMEVAERLRKTIQETGIAFKQGFPLHFTASIGAAFQSGPGNTVDKLLKQADQALYEAKLTGRNRVCAARQPPDPEHHPPHADDA